MAQTRSTSYDQIYKIPDINSYSWCLTQLNASAFEQKVTNGYKDNRINKVTSYNLWQTEARNLLKTRICQLINHKNHIQRIPLDNCS